MLHLYLVRHAKATTNSPSGRDMDRPLHAKGLKQLQNLHTYLKEKNLKVAVIQISAAKRTRETYKGLKNLFEAEVQVKNEMYLASKVELNALVTSSINGGNSRMIIGHNEGISELASYYVGDHIQMPTCAFIHLEFNLESWDLVSPDTARIADHYFPSGD